LSEFTFHVATNIAATLSGPAAAALADPHPLASSAVRITVWNDYICPWAYAARPHTAWLESEGHEVIVRSYELHPDLPPDGRAVRAGGRLDKVFDHIADICDSSGLEFVKPQRSPNTHKILGVCEVVQAHAPESFRAFDRELAAIHWVRGQSLDDPDIVRLALQVADAPVDQIEELVADGEGERLLEQSMADALEFEVTGTPAWRIGELTISGLHPLEQFQRWVNRLAARNAP